jgi:hypothetical protein
LEEKLSFRELSLVGHHQLTQGHQELHFLLLSLLQLLVFLLLELKGYLLEKHLLSLKNGQQVEGMKDGFLLKLVHTVSKGCVEDDRGRRKCWPAHTTALCNSVGVGGDQKNG